MDNSTQQRPLSPSFFRGGSSSSSKKERDKETTPATNTDVSMGMEPQGGGGQFDPPSAWPEPPPPIVHRSFHANAETLEGEDEYRHYYGEEQDDDILMEDFPGADDAIVETVEQMESRLDRLVSNTWKLREEQQENIEKAYLDEIEKLLLGDTSRRMNDSTFQKLWEKVVSLVSSENFRVRKWVAYIVDKMCREKENCKFPSVWSCREYISCIGKNLFWAAGIPRVVYPLVTLAKDKHHEVVMRVAAATNNILRKAMRITVVHPWTGQYYHRDRIPSEIQDMWKTFLDLRETLFSLLSSETTQEGVRSAVIKLMETTIFTQTKPSKESIEKVTAASKTGMVAAQSTGTDAFTLNDIPERSGLHDKRSLKKEADRLMSLLLDHLHSNPATKNPNSSISTWTHKTYSDIIKTVAWVASRRPKDPLSTVSDESAIHDYLVGREVKEAKSTYAYVVSERLTNFTYNPPPQMRRGRKRGIDLLPRLNNSIKFCLLNLMNLRSIRKEEGAFKHVAEILGECLTDLGKGDDVKKLLQREVKGKYDDVAVEDEDEEDEEEHGEALTGLKSFSIPENKYNVEDYLKLGWEDRISCILRNFDFIPEGTPQPPHEIISSAAECLVMARLNTSSKHNVEEERSQLLEHPPLDLVPSEGGTHLGAVLQMIAEICPGEQIPSRARSCWDDDEISALFATVQHAKDRQTGEKDVSDRWSEILSRKELETGNSSTHIFTDGTGDVETVESVDRLGNQVETLRADNIGQTSLSKSITNAGSARMPGIPSNILKKMCTTLKEGNNSICPGIEPILTATRKAFSDAEKNAREKLKEEKQSSSLEGDKGRLKEEESVKEKKKVHPVNKEKEILMKHKIPKSDKNVVWKWGDNCFQRILNLVNQEWLQLAGQEAQRRYASLLARQATNPTGIVLSSFINECLKSGDDSRAKQFGKSFCKSRKWRLEKILTLLAGKRGDRERSLDRMPKLCREICLAVLFAELAIGHYMPRGTPMDKLALTPPTKADEEFIRPSSKCCTSHYECIVERFVELFLQALASRKSTTEEQVFENLKIVLEEAPQLPQVVFDMLAGAAFSEHGDKSISLLETIIETRPKDREVALESLLSLAFTTAKETREKAIIALIRRVIKVHGLTDQVVSRSESIFESLLVNEETETNGLDKCPKEFAKLGAEARQDMNSLNHRRVKNVQDAIRRLQLFFICSCEFPTLETMDRLLSIQSRNEGLLQRIVSVHMEVMNKFPTTSSGNDRQVRLAVSNAFGDELSRLIKQIVNRYNDSGQKNGVFKVIDWIWNFQCLYLSGSDTSEESTGQNTHRRLPPFPNSNGELSILSDIFDVIVEEAGSTAGNLTKLCKALFERFYLKDDLKTAGHLSLLCKAVRGLGKDDVLAILPVVVTEDSGIRERIITNICRGGEENSISPAILLAAVCSMDEAVNPSGESSSIATRTSACVPELNEALENRPMAKWNPSLPLEGEVIKSTVLPYLKAKKKESFSAISILEALNRLVDSHRWPKCLVEILREAFRHSSEEISKHDFVSLLDKMVGKQVWLYNDLWSDFISTCHLGLPDSLAVFCRLPRPQLEYVVNKGQSGEILRGRLREWANEPQHQEDIGDDVLDLLGVELKIDREAIARQQEEQRLQEQRLEESRNLAQRGQQRHPMGQIPQSQHFMPRPQLASHQQPLLPGHGRMPPPPGHPYGYHPQMQGNLHQGNSPRGQYPRPPQHDNNGFPYPPPPRYSNQQGGYQYHHPQHHGMGRGQPQGGPNGQPYPHQQGRGPPRQRHHSDQHPDDRPSKSRRR